MDLRTQPSPTSTPHLDRDVATPTRFGRYIFAGELGTGGMGVVYAAYDPELERMVAVKLLRDGSARLQQRLRREAQVMARLAHPNVVAIHDVGMFEGRMFIAMEYVEGETLGHWAARPRSQREILDAYCAAGRGLAAAHAAGIVHRDFKPDNVLVGNDGRVRVGDFGLAGSASVPGCAPAPRCAPVPHCASVPRCAPLPRCSAGAVASPAPMPALTAPGALLGTRYYMAPELYKGVDADMRSDQFSFCVALFTALYGVWPYEGDTPDAPASDVCNSDPPVRRLPRRSLGPRVARRVRAALRRGLAVDPAARFASLDELLAQLEHSPRRSLRWTVAAGAALAIVALRIGQPAAPAQCSLEPDPVAQPSFAERPDDGKPTASALFDPATPATPPARVPRADRELCPGPMPTVEH